MAYDTVLAYLDVVSYLESINHTVFVDVNAVSNRHLHVLQSALMLGVGGPDDALFSDDGVKAYDDLSQVGSDH